MKINKKEYHLNRRTALKTSALGILGLYLPNAVNANKETPGLYNRSVNKGIPKYFPNIDPEITEEVVGKSHFDLEGLKKLVEVRPELAKSVWEWRFGDFESAIGAASHVGRRDIALYLMNKGARPTIFTFAMLGSFEVIKSIVGFSPDIQKIRGPHGISLLDHAYAGERMKDKMTHKEIDSLKRTVDFLESIGDANGDKYLDISPEEQKMYLGDYKYGPEEKDGFTIGLNMKKLLSLGPIGGFGGALYKMEENKFTYNGAPSVLISFDFENENVKSLTLKEPNLKVVAEKIQ